ncbi:hypothetical protein Tco_0277313 [Tanacetum coccineum]
MNFPEFYKELEAEFLGASAKRTGIQLLQLELRLEKTPSRSFRPVKLAEILWQFWALSSFGVSLAHDGSWSKWQATPPLTKLNQAFQACKQEEGQSVSTYVLKMKAYLDQMERLGYPMPLALGVNMILTSLSKDYDQFVQNYNMHDMGKTIPELHAMLKLEENGILKKTPAVLAIRQGQIQKPKSQARGKGKQRGKGKSKLAYDPKHKIPPPTKKEHPAKDTKVEEEQSQCIWNNQGLRGYQKLNKGALDLYVVNGNTAAVEAIGSFDLILPSGMILILDNCHFPPTIPIGYEDAQPSENTSLHQHEVKPDTVEPQTDVILVRRSQGYLKHLNDMVSISMLRNMS